MLEEECEEAAAAGCGPEWVAETEVEEVEEPETEKTVRRRRWGMAEVAVGAVCEAGPVEDEGVDASERGVESAEAGEGLETEAELASESAPELKPAVAGEAKAASEDAAETQAG